MRTKRMAVIVAIIAAMFIPASGIANAAPVLTTASTTLSPASLPDLTPTVKWHWWGVEVKFNKGQTKLIAAGWAGAAGALIGKILGAAIAIPVITEYASQATESGNCLQISRTWGGFQWPSIYSC